MGFNVPSSPNHSVTLTLLLQENTRDSSSFTYFINFYILRVPLCTTGLSLNMRRCHKSPGLASTAAPKEQGFNPIPTPCVLQGFFQAASSLFHNQTSTVQPLVWESSTSSKALPSRSQGTAGGVTEDCLQPFPPHPTAKEPTPDPGKQHGNVHQSWTHLCVCALEAEPLHKPPRSLFNLIQGSTAIPL